MAHLEVRVFIEAPADVVWSILSDLPGQARWMVDVRGLAVVSERQQGEGALIDVTSELFGLPVVHDVMEITRWQPPARMDVLHRGQFHGTGSFVLAPVAGGTIFTWVEDFSPPLGALGEFAFRLVVRPHLTQVFTRSLANLKRLAES